MGLSYTLCDLTKARSPCQLRGETLRWPWIKELMRMVPQDWLVSLFYLYKEATRH